MPPGLVKIPVDTRRKLNVHKTFRRRPGRLLNVLCTFNLPPVSTGVWSKTREKTAERKKIWIKISEVKSSIHSRLLMPFVKRLSARFPRMLEVCTGTNLQLKQSSFRFPLINTYSSWNHQKTIDFPIISGGIEVNWFA